MMIYNAAAGDIERIEWVRRNRTIPDLMKYFDLRGFENHAREKDFEAQTKKR